LEEVNHAGPGAEEATRVRGFDPMTLAPTDHRPTALVTGPATGIRFFMTAGLAPKLLRYADWQDHPLSSRGLGANAVREVA
jgi:hypothetical protein